MEWKPSFVFMEWEWNEIKRVAGMESKFLALFCLNGIEIYELNE